MVWNHEMTIRCCSLPALKNAKGAKLTSLATFRLLCPGPSARSGLERGRLLLLTVTQLSWSPSPQCGRARTTKTSTSPGPRGNDDTTEFKGRLISKYRSAAAPHGYGLVIRWGLLWCSAKNASYEAKRDSSLAILSQASFAFLPLPVFLFAPASTVVRCPPISVPCRCGTPTSRWV